MERMFDRFWFLIIVAIGSYTVMKKAGDVYFWVIDKTKTVVGREYAYLTEDHKVIQPDDFGEGIS